MYQIVGMEEAKSKLAELVGQAKYGGKRFLLQRRGRPMAVLVGVEEFEQIEAQAFCCSRGLDRMDMSV